MSASANPIPHGEPGCRMLYSAGRKITGLPVLQGTYDE
jgi:hypothetical protein